MEYLSEVFPDFNFDVEEGLLHDTSQESETLTGS